MSKQIQTTEQAAEQVAIKEYHDAIDFITSYEPTFTESHLRCLTGDQVRFIYRAVRASLPSFMTVDCETVQAGDHVTVWSGNPYHEIIRVVGIVSLDGTITTGDNITTRKHYSVSQCYESRSAILRAAINGDEGV